MNLPSWPVVGDREWELLREVLTSPQWGGFHEMVTRFEKLFAGYHLAAHGVSAFNGTVTLEMALAAAGVGPGDEVIVPAISFISSATAISRVGATPVFVDIEPKTYNIDPIRAALAITERTKGIMAVHFGGPMAQMDRLLELGDAFRIPVFEDAAHAHGTSWNGRMAGSLGLFGSFSFQNGKVMTSGEGGIVITNDSGVAARMREIANQGRRADGESFFHHYSLGSNFRMTGLQAAVLIAQFERLPRQIETRQRNAKILFNALADAPEIVWQRSPAESQNHCYYLLVGRTAQRDAFCERLKQRGIPVTPFYPHTLYENPLYCEPGRCVVHECPVAEQSIRDSFWFPHRVLMGDDETTHQLAREVKECLT